MQTFLPYPEFDRSAAALDRARLGKQRVETLQVVRALLRETYGWKNHPAVKMWAGHVEALAAYGHVVTAEWVRAGRPDTCSASIDAELAERGIALPRAYEEIVAAGALPRWVGDEHVHRSHRSALVRKDPAHYAPLFPDVPPDLPYVWPDP